MADEIRINTKAAEEALRQLDRVMQEKRKVTERIVRKLRAVMDTREILVSYIRDMTAVISPDIWGQQMVVDRNDIWANMMTMEEKIMHLANIGYYARVSSWDIYTISPDQKTRKAEERYYKQVETVREDIVPAYFRRIQALMAEVTRIYQEKVVVYENIDDEYYFVTYNNYQEHKDLCDALGNAGTAFVDTVGDIVVGAVDGVWDMVVGLVSLVGGILYTAASGITCGFCWLFDLKPPEWADEQIESVKTNGGAILKDPLLLVEGIAQGASDAIEQKGIAYCAGYIVGPILVTKGITEGIDKLRAARSSFKYLKQLNNLSENKINHIINGSKNSTHGWEKLVPNKNWDDIKKIIVDVMDTGVEGPYKSVYSKKAMVNGFEVEVTYTKLSDGTIRISDAWVNQ